MSEGEVISERGFEVRGDLSPEQEKVCNQLIDVLEGLDGVEIQAIGMTHNMVVRGRKESPCVWFKPKGITAELKMSAAIDTFRKRKVAVVSDYSFFPNKDAIEAIPFGPTLDRYVLPEVQIVLED